MSRNLVFLTRDRFTPSTGSYRFLPFRFMPFDGQVFLANEVGEHLFLDRPTFDAFVEHRLEPTDPSYKDLRGKHFLFDSNPRVALKLLATKYRTKRAHLEGFTKLHIFVLTLRCDHTCQYCQVSRVSADRMKYDMSRDTADRALDLVFRVPARAIKIEFQGGEPLLNFELLRYVVEEATRRNESHQKDLQFVVCTNLAPLDRTMLDFLREHSVLISTSLDGPAFIHNANRPRPGRDSYERTIAGIDRVRDAMGARSVSALMTTTSLSLDHPEEIVDEYVRRGFEYIFLRPISPYGFAVRTRARTGYDVERFLTFYRRALDRIIEHNRQGTFLIEAYAQLLLRRMLTPFATGYVDLQSPSGAGIGAVVYNYDGDVYASDEGRMLAEMGDTTFRMGSVYVDSYDSLFNGELLRTLAATSCVEGLPGCADCAFQTYCGCDPVENHTTQGSILGHRPTSAFCQRNMALMKHLLRLYYGEDRFIRELFWSWVHNVPTNALLPTLPD